MSVNKSPEYLDQKFDAIIIGAGMGGLSTANYLSSNGKKVLVLEQHRTPGGYVCGFKRKGYYFDGANTSFSSHGIVFPLLQEIGVKDKLQWNLHSISVQIPELDLNFRYSTMDDFIKDLSKTFSNEPGIHAYLEKMSDFHAFFALLEKYPVPTIHFGLKGLFIGLSFFRILFEKRIFRILRTVLKEGRIATRDLAARYFSMESAAYRYFSNFGSPTQAALITGAMILEFMKDKWYPTGGEQHFANVLAETAQSHGATFIYKCLVTKIITRNGIAVGVDTTQGKFSAQYIISDSDYRRTFLQMLDTPDLLPLRMRKKLVESGISESMVHLYIGARYSADELTRLLNGNHAMFYPVLEPMDIAKQADNQDYFKRMTLSIFAPSLIDQTLAPEGCQGINVQTLAPNYWGNNWGNNDPVVYKELKAKIAEDILKNLEILLPDIRKRMEFMEVATPKTYHRYTLNEGGAYCAWSWEPGKSYWEKADVQRLDTPVKNLYVVSDWNYKIGGLCATMISGKKMAYTMGVPV